MSSARSCRETGYPRTNRWYVSTATHTPLCFSYCTKASDTFLEMFRNNLLDIGIDPISYGTHSFRRGGCQYLASCRRWVLRRICEWGGWSTEFTHMTIVKYLIGWNDNPSERREDFFNPNVQPTVKCPSCGRTCRCS